MSKKAQLDDDEAKKLKGLLTEIMKKYDRQEDLAAKLGYSQQHLSNVLNGKHRGSPDLARQVCTELGEPLERLFPSELGHYGDIPGWKNAETAVAKSKVLPPAALKLARSIPIYRQAPIVTPQIVYSTALWAWCTLSPEERKEFSTDEEDTNVSKIIRKVRPLDSETFRVGK